MKNITSSENQGDYELKFDRRTFLQVSIVTGILLTLLQNFPALAAVDPNISRLKIN